MNQGQEQFLKFILEKAASEHHDDIKKVLHEAFGKQNDGSFGLDDIAGLGPKLLDVVKNEHLDEVKGVLEGFAKNFGK